MAPRGTSRSVNVRNIGQSKYSSTPYARTLGPQALRREEVQGQALVREELAGLGTTSSSAIAEIQGKINRNQPDDMPVDDTQPINDDGDPSWEDVPEQDTDFAHAIRDLIDEQYRGRVPSDLRTWKQRIEREQENWAPLVPAMVEAYLHWKYPQAAGEAEDEMNIDAVAFDINVLDLFTLDQSVNVKRHQNSESPAVDLVLHGFIGNVPQQPSLAISIRTLELFLQIRRRKASFSVEAFAKVLCDLYKKPYQRRYRVALSNAFDMYLILVRAVETRVSTALGRNEPNWRALNACKACCYELEGEDDFDWRRMLALDANFSLKRMASGTRKTADTRVFLESDYYLRDADIARYADEVTRPVRGPTVPTGNGDSDDEDNQLPTGGDPTDGDTTTSTSGCAERWKAASSDDKKRMWNAFDESGLFASSCRHGMILWITDLVQSGELAKYPLATVAQALDVLGDRLLIGYDIGCTFAKTVENSSLGEKFKASKSRFCVNAFHGYSHSYDCQKENHPNVIQGMGLEDLETLERVFSASNALASVIRYMSAYRRRVFIDIFFKQWDADKYANVALMLYNNYCQALKIIDEEEPALLEAMKELEISREDLDQWHQEEATYFRNLGSELPYDVKRVEYVELLQKFRELQASLENSRTFFLSTPADTETDYYVSLSQTRKRESERRYLRERLDQINHEIILYEESLGIQVRWSPQTQEYIDALRYANEREYNRALDQLQKLVIKRLFELQRMNLSQTGYRMRSHIAKALQRRCKAIRRAVKRYNAAAIKMNPPRPTLDWSKASHYAFLEEFELLRGSRQDLQEKRWADATIRHAMKQDLRIRRAKEEIKKCNCEIRRVQTGIVDEHILFDARLEDLKKANNPIYDAVLEYTKIQKGVNYQLLARLYKIYALPGFTGDPTPGIKKGDTALRAGLDDDPAVRIAQAQQEIEDEGGCIQSAGDDLDELEDEQARDVVQMIDYVADLPRETVNI